MVGKLMERWWRDGWILVEGWWNGGERWWNSDEMVVETVEEKRIYIYLKKKKQKT